MHVERTGKECSQIDTHQLAARATALIMAFDMNPKLQCHRLLRLAEEIGLDSEEVIDGLELEGLPAWEAAESLFYFLEEELEEIQTKKGKWQ